MRRTTEKISWNAKIPHAPVNELFTISALKRRRQKIASIYENHALVCGVPPSTKFSKTAKKEE
jgi:hypothetical protein